MTRAGVVAIGRNEGERLRKCLESIVAQAKLGVYVDSGSTDNSVALARGIVGEVVELDARTPFTAARARNEGLRRLRQIAPHLPYVQFVDGDCEIVAGWIDTAVAFLDSHHYVGAVCGRRREQYPERSVYNMLCDQIWDAPEGDAMACGGDAMVRVEAFEKIGGYRADLIAGEDPEICVRLRAAGWKIWRLSEEMTLHDAAILRFSQWWKRTVRAGFAFAEGAALHGALPEKHGVRESLRAWIWALALPLAVVVCTTLTGPWGMTALAVYPIQVARLAMRGNRSRRANWWIALFLVLGKFPELLGQMQFWARRIAGGRPRLIEYK